MKLSKTQQLEKALEMVKDEIEFGTLATTFDSRWSVISLLENEWIDDPEVHEAIIKTLKDKHGIDVDKKEQPTIDSVKRSLERHARFSNEPATQKQINFLASLFVQKNESLKDWELGADNFNTPLSKNKASSIIEHLA